MRSLLSNAVFEDLQRVCHEQMNAPDGAQLSQNLLTKVQSCQSITALFNTLAKSPCWSWIDIRLLSVMAAASGLVECIELLESYKQSVFSRKLIDVIPNAPSRKVKDEYYSKLVAKLDKDSNEVTVSDLLETHSELEKVILDINNGVCVLDHLEDGCILIHWLIPSVCRDDAYQSAKRRCEKFKDCGLLYLKIGDYPVIYQPSPSHEVAVPVPHVSTGKSITVGELL